MFYLENLYIMHKEKGHISAVGYALLYARAHAREEIVLFLFFRGQFICNIAPLGNTALKSHLLKERGSCRKGAFSCLERAFFKLHLTDYISQKGRMFPENTGFTLKVKENSFSLMRRAGSSSGPQELEPTALLR